MAASATLGYTDPAAGPVAGTSPVDATAEDALLVFALSGRRFAVPRVEVRSLLPMAALVEPPNGPPLLAGFLMLPDMALPVLNLARLLGLPELPPTPATALLRLKGSAPRAVMVDRALAIVRPAAGSWRKVAPEESFGGVLRAEVMLDGEFCGILTPHRLLLREEEARVEAFRARAEARRRDLADPDREEEER